MNDFIEATCIMCKTVHPEHEDCPSFPLAGNVIAEIREARKTEQEWVFLVWLDKYLDDYEK